MCPAFKGMSIEARSRHVKSSNSCFNCLGTGHRTRDCKSISRCKTCARSHHTLLHRAPIINESNNQAVDSSAGPSTSSSSAGPAADNSGVSEGSVNQVTPNSTMQASLSMTSKVILESPSGKQVVARALLDSGAGLSLSEGRSAIGIAQNFTPNYHLRSHGDKGRFGISHGECSTSPYED